MTGKLNTLRIRQRTQNDPRPKRARKRMGMSYINQVIGTELNPRYPDDVERIQKVLKEHGFSLTPQQAEEAWELYGDDMAAGWMMLPESDDEVWSILSGEML